MVEIDFGDKYNLNKGFILTRPSSINEYINTLIGLGGPKIDWFTIKFRDSEIVENVMKNMEVHLK